MSSLPPVLIGMTSIRGREKALCRTLDTLLRQRPPQDGRRVRLNLFLSQQPYLLDEGFQSVPSFIQRRIAWSQGRRIELECHFVENVGPYRKLLPLIARLTEQQKENDPYLVTADDDTLYPQDWLVRLLDAQDTLQCVVGFRGRRMMVKEGKVEPYHRWIKHDSSLTSPHLLTVPTGKDGICYRLSQLHAAVSDTEAALRLAGHADDLWFKHHTLKLGIPSVLLNPSLSLEFPELTASGRRIRAKKPEVALKSLFLTINKSGGNDAVMKRLTDPAFYPLGDESQ
ncbi:hypothetical protein [Cyanobium sp. NIES-981]|uniref:hypothetical protein n=1 Tax=Cyanobium sp. NIES-981 TaxID=1851505 RepID=UPI0007DDE13B|nr:hypothetical protein [Cyanobium sp. NIES-981]SBO44589.1 conserved protein of unknown function [Cyanobium sp. NIES-981]